LINGSEKEVPETTFFAFVDVRDVGEAHARRAHEIPEAAGQRYFCTAGGYTYRQICDIIKEDFSKNNLVLEGKLGAPYLDMCKVDNSKVNRELGMNFRDLHTCMHDQVVEFIEIEKRTKA
jgi:nucleoside-diphosphate-sugar epimerase